MINPLDGFGGGAPQEPDASDADALLALDAKVDADADTADTKDDADAAAELPGLVAYWDFDLSGGNILVDRTGHGHQGLIFGGPTTVPGVRGNALSFTGVNQRVEFSSLNGANTPRSGTLSIWVNSAYGTSADYVLFGSWSATNQIRVYNPKGTTQLATNFGVHTTDGSFATAFSVRSDMVADKWQHFVIVWDSDNAIGNVYVDGFRWTGPWTQPGWTPSEQEFTIARYIVGTVDEVRLYELPFAEEDVARIP